jgi:hypothetical protein
MDLSQFARLLAVMGLVLLTLAGLIYLLSRFNIPVGQLPGDLVFQRGNFSCIIPLASSLLISILLTLVVNLLISIFRK